MRRSNCCSIRSVLFGVILGALVFLWAVGPEFLGTQPIPPKPYTQM